MILRNNYCCPLLSERPDQSRPDLTRTDQTRPGLARLDQAITDQTTFRLERDGPD